MTSSTGTDEPFWALDQGMTFLNHGSYGACPRPVLAAQRSWVERMEVNPVVFMEETLQPALDGARSSLAQFLGADPGGVVPVPNATTGINAVLRSIQLNVGDELVTTDHAYPAVRYAMEARAAESRARLVVANVPFPIQRPEQVVEAVLQRITGRSRLVVVDHVTSMTSAVFPVERLVTELEPEVPVLVDGAHAVGMLPLAIDALGASYYAGNCHKWLSAPKGSGFLVSRPDVRESLRPVTISHGWRAPSQSRYHSLFDWTGTFDPSAWLTVPEAIRLVGSRHRDGWEGVMRRNRDLALRARDLLCSSLDVAPPVPDDMVGSMASVPLPPAPGQDAPPIDPLAVRLRNRHRIEVPVIAFPAWPRRVVRISAHLYNEEADYSRLVDALSREL